jgi:hypothetical protein
MTYARREEIFSKEYLSIADLQELLDLKYQGAAELMRTIKRKLEYNGQGVRLDIQGKLHIEDYFDYFRIRNVDRYKKIEEAM